MLNRRRAWEILEVAEPGDRASRVFDIAMVTLIILNVGAVILDSITLVNARWGSFFRYFEVISVAAFTLEYAARLWSCPTDARFAHGLRGRLRLATRPMLVVDLVAILPFYLPFLGFDLRSVRALRLLRLARLAKIGRYYASLQLIERVLRAKKEELLLTTALMGVLLLVSSSVLYYCENSAQPDVFSSIPTTMWWAVATLTTVGYGDMYPVTTAGRIFASVIAILGIGMFALPTGILGAGFVDEIQRARTKGGTCPRCGKPSRQPDE